MPKRKDRQLLCLALTKRAIPLTLGVKAQSVLAPLNSALEIRVEALAEAVQMPSIAHWTPKE